MLRYTNMARDVLRRMRWPSPAKPSGNRERLIGSVERALARRAKRRASLRRLGVASIATAAAAALIVGWAATRYAARGPAIVDGLPPPRALAIVDDGSGNPTIGAGVVIVDSSGRHAASRGVALAQGARLVASAASEVRIGTGDGTFLILERHSALLVVEQGRDQRFALERGAVRVQVAPLRAGERFVIASPDAVVEVHGTVFRLAIVPSNPACAAAVKTHVSVFEGVVGVRAAGVEAFVLGGSEWPAGCVAAIESSRAAPALATASRADRPLAPASAHATARATDLAQVPSASQLAAQNDLFAAAVRAKRQQKASEAIGLFARLIDDFPNGPLTESAMAQQMRLLAATNATSGARAASAYLARFPGGFSRDEARRLADPRVP